MESTWIHVIADAAVVAMVGWNISVIKKFIEKLFEQTELAHQRLNVHDRISSEIIHQQFDSESIANGRQGYPFKKENGRIK